MPAKKEQPVCVTVFPWLRDNLGKRCLAGLTGADHKALMAAVQLVQLWSYDRHRDVAEAFALTVGRMQPHMREYAYHAIAHVMEWGHREELWREAGLDPVEPQWVCAWDFASGGKGDAQFT